MFGLYNDVQMGKYIAKNTKDLKIDMEEYHHDNKLFLNVFFLFLTHYRLWDKISMLKLVTCRFSTFEALDDHFICF